MANPANTLSAPTSFSSRLYPIWNYTSSENTGDDLQVVKAATPGQIWVCTRIRVSFDASGTALNELLTLTIGSTVVGIEAMSVAATSTHRVFDFAYPEGIFGADGSAFQIDATVPASVKGYLMACFHAIKP